jgi:hypothetical protein
MDEQTKIDIVNRFFNKDEYPQHTISELASMFNVEPSEIEKVLAEYNRCERIK